MDVKVQYSFITHIHPPVSSIVLSIDFLVLLATERFIMYRLERYPSHWCLFYMSTTIIYISVVRPNNAKLCDEFKEKNHGLFLC
jgi:hypothetical protein